MFSLFPFLIYAVITAVTPGPNNIMSMSIAQKRGFRGALPFNLGVLAGFLVVMLLSTYFSALLTALIPLIKFPMMLLGAGYLIYLAYQVATNVSAIAESEVEQGFNQGFLLQFVNPKLYLYGLISMEVYILPAFGQQPGMLLAFAVILSLIGFIFTLLWAFLGAVFQTLFSTYGRLTNRLLALLLVYCALALFFE